MDANDLRGRDHGSHGSWLLANPPCAAVVPVLQRGCRKVSNGGSPGPVITRWHIDNTALSHTDPVKRARIDRLLDVQPPVGSQEWTELLQHFRDSDRLFEESANSFRAPVDVAFRRGGVLQACMFLDRPEWQHLLIERLRAPKFYVFLRAELQTIRRSYAEDENLTHVLRQDPTAGYCRSAEEAYELQERRLEAVQKLSGLTWVTRSEPDVMGIAREVIPAILPLLSGFGCQLRENQQYSYATHLKTNHLREIWRTSSAVIPGVWFDEWEIAIGDSIPQKISEALKHVSHVVVILSKSSVDKPWVEKELYAAMRQLRDGSVSILPVVIDDCVIPSIPEDIKYADCRRNHLHGLNSVLDFDSLSAS